MNKKNKLIIIFSSIGSAILGFIFFIFHFKNTGKKQEQKIYQSVKKSNDEIRETIRDAQKSANKIEENSKKTINILNKYNV